MIYAYINERSIEGQFCNDFGVRFNAVIQIISTLKSSALNDVTVMINTDLYNKEICNATNERVTAFLDRNKETKKRFQLMIQKATVYRTVLNDDDIYGYEQLYVDNCSMSEAYEKQAQGNDKVVLVNFGDTPFPEDALRIEKNLVAHQDVQAVCSETRLGAWMVSSHILKQYGRDNKVKVLDEQTILTDPTLFTPTDHRSQGRVIYKRNDVPEYWYVDNLHTGGSAHLEVFKSSDMHFKGTCDIDDITTFREAPRSKRGRTISFD